MNWNGGSRVRIQRQSNNNNPYQYRRNRVPIRNISHLNNEQSFTGTGNTFDQFRIRRPAESPTNPVVECPLLRNCKNLSQGDLLALQLSLHLGIGQRQSRPSSSLPRSDIAENNIENHNHTVDLISADSGSSSSRSTTSPNPSVCSNASNTSNQPPHTPFQLLTIQGEKSPSYSPLSQTQNQGQSQHQSQSACEDGHYSFRSISLPSKSSSNQNLNKRSSQQIHSIGETPGRKFFKGGTSGRNDRNNHRNNI